MPTEYTRGQLVARQIKAHPEITEDEIAATIDAHIRAEVAHLRDSIIAMREGGHELPASLFRESLGWDKETSPDDIIARTRSTPPTPLEDGDDWELTNLKGYP